MHRVVITGAGAVSPFGWGVPPMLEGLKEGRCSLSRLEDADVVGGMLASVGGKAPDFDAGFIPREYRRAMSRTNIMAFMAASEALRSAGVEPSLPLPPEHAHMGCCVASTISSPRTLEDFFCEFLRERGVGTVRSTTFFKIMNHALPSNIQMCFGLRGRCLSLAAACAGALQCIGQAFETIAFGRAKMMLCGGAEEFHPLLPATFDRLGAATPNPDPDTASRPFDLDRQGIVCSEGAGLFLLEEYEHAIQRNAPILGEIAGFATNLSPSSLVFPDTEAIGSCMLTALEVAGLSPRDIDLISAHATATEAGDIAEGQAISRIFGRKPLVNSLKGYMGHCMAASGALELMGAIGGAKEGFAHGTRNLQKADPRCGDLNLSSDHTPQTVRYLLKNSFGLGGVNTSLIIKL